jgi:predicted chitinase
MDYPVRAGELGHNEAAPALIADQAPEDRIGDTSHGCKHRGWRYPRRTDLKFTGETGHPKLF